MNTHSPHEVSEAMRLAPRTVGANEVELAAEPELIRDPLHVRVDRFKRRADVRDVIATTAELLVGAFTLFEHVDLITDSSLMLGEPRWIPVFFMAGTALFALVCYGSLLLYRRDFFSALRKSQLPLSMAAGEVQPNGRMSFDLESPDQSSLEGLVWRISKSPRGFFGNFTRMFSRSWLVIYYLIAAAWLFTSLTFPYWIGMSDMNYIPYFPIFELVLPPIVMAHLRTVRHRQVVNELRRMLLR
jgi:hypothetical protein